MIQQYQIYKCNICGNVVEVLYAGGGQLVCCGQPMELLQEKTEDVGMEKHVPVVEKTEKGIKVKVGSVPHPMEESHYIQWIEVVTQNGSFKKFLKPGELPEAEFCVGEGDLILVREYCNLHGLWKK
ncbi:MAG: desulfoferrodoxin [Microgenomates group bacterium]